ncbi:hypothetical protein [Rubrivivax sp. A210]|uniref:hypothetical protein n=1 Tax=Rubrivivax sp. A210 TaxID=2772301 RepID=UPI00191A74D7
MKPRCTNSKERRISRWEHEDILDDLQERLEGAPEAMRLRRQTVEHVFGTLKGWMGSNRFLTKTLPRGRGRDEFAGPGVQPEAGDQAPRSWSANQFDEGVGREPSIARCAGSAGAANEVAHRRDVRVGCAQRRMRVFPHGLGRQHQFAGGGS